ncbi:hypothetical protein TrRE_jg4543, partial [Triparma retinervis]
DPSLDTSPVEVEVEVEVTSPSSSNTLKTLEEIETELSDIEEEIRLLDEEEKEAKEKAEEVEFVDTSVKDIFGPSPPSDLDDVNIDVIMDNQELPPSLSSDAPNAEGSQSASTLAREVDVAGEMALRALDVSFLLLEKGLSAAPEVQAKVETAGRRADEALKDGTGEKGWKLLTRVNRGSTKE